METLIRKTNPIRMRNYGRILQDMVAYACTLEDESARQVFTMHIAQCMRQKNIAWNKDQDSGVQRIKDDIYTLSNGKLNCEFEGFEQKIQQMTSSNNGNNNANKKKKK